MANNYCQSSFCVECNQEERDAWLSIADIADAYLSGDPEELLPKYENMDPELVTAVKSVAFEFEDWGSFGVTFDVEDDSIWFHHDESFNVEMAAAFLQLWLKLLKSEKHIVFSWACTCSKPRVDEFDGGSVVVTAEQNHWFSGTYMASSCVQGLDLRPTKELVESAEEEAGWTPDTVRELVIEFMDDRPAMKMEFENFIQSRVEADLEATDEKET